MTDKRFYQDAADEVASGILDQSLWIKACAEMPDASHVAQQAKYIQLRAIELAIASAKGRATDVARKAKPIALKIVRLSILLLFAVVAVTLFIVYPTNIFNQINEAKAVIRENQNNFLIPQSDDDRRGMMDAAYNAYMAAANGCDDLRSTKRRVAGTFLYSFVSDASLDEYCVRLGSATPVYRISDYRRLEIEQEAAY